MGHRPRFSWMSWRSWDIERCRRGRTLFIAMWARMRRGSPGDCGRQESACVRWARGARRVACALASGRRSRIGLFWRLWGGLARGGSSVSSAHGQTGDGKSSSKRQRRRPLGLKPRLIRCFRGPGGPLFHGTARIRDTFESRKATVDFGRPYARLKNCAALSKLGTDAFRWQSDGS